VTEFLLGTHEPGWFGRSPVPLFVSMERRHKFPKKPRVHKPGWSLDSGGFTVVTNRGGWTQSPEQYLEAVYELADHIGGMRWAAPQDWMCEQVALDSTGKTVAEHQRLTVENFCQLHEIDERKLIIPALQGFAPGEHEQCILLYERAGVSLWDHLVGVGTICRREATREIEGVIRSLSEFGLRLHGFGVKTSGLKRYGHLLTSADSLAWSFRARKAARHGEGPLGRGCVHDLKGGACNNCFVWAHQWREQVVARGLGSSS
jgi:hypothetical protein